MRYVPELQRQNNSLVWSMLAITLLFRHVRELTAPLLFRRPVCRSSTVAASHVCYLHHHQRSMQFTGDEFSSSPARIISDLQNSRDDLSYYNHQLSWSTSRAEDIPAHCHLSHLARARLDAIPFAGVHAESCDLTAEYSVSADPVFHLSGHEASMSWRYLCLYQASAVGRRGVSQSNNQNAFTLCELASMACRSPDFDVC
ncbi:hypothetical protein P280DRAFT_101613 [Massarina eburnea CBS 473.64]|uniref:Uncharacterized protein n=1 Tax=Massarina eburnea CBS 473.64 TaxID=1395130 RepID=A0A6A6RTN6_9PLEO|nr:hypothetical protein P280DRAFT_101613 [Massarina eburnea CBS 473.64]